MKQDRVAGMVLAVINVILIAVCIVLYLRIDRTAPKLEFQASETVYREGADNQGLLLNITAYDSVDGDVTDRIVIEKTIEDRENNTMVVFYAVSDKSGNVAKASRVFPAIYAEEMNKDNELNQFLEAGINAELSSAAGEEAVEEVFSDDVTAEPVEDATSFPIGEPAEEPTQAPTQAPSVTPQPTPEPEPAPKPVPTADPSVPVISLNTSEVKVNAGQGPAWVDVIGTLSDDKDNYETLFKNLSVSKYDMNRPGTYQVTVSTEDSDGNRSAGVPLTIIVI